MPGVLTIAKKEFVDHVSDHTFLLCFGIFLVSMIASTFYQLDQIYQLMAYVAPTAGFLEKELWRDPEVSEMLQTVLASQLSTLGVLVALTLSFNSINKERAEGSLKVLLSYPIYRDQVILGKLLAGLLVLSVATAASMVVSMAVCIKVAEFTPETGTLQNYAAFFVLSIILLSGYLGLSVLLSLTFKEAKTTLLFMFFLLGVFNSEVLYSYGLMMSNTVYGPAPRDFDILKAFAFNPQAKSLQQLIYWAHSSNPQAQALQEFFAGLSPAQGFTSTALALRVKYRVILSGSVMSYLSFWDIVMNNLKAITALVLIPIITFTGSYVLFTRRDVT